MLAIAVQLVATLHFNDPQDLQRARDLLSSAGFNSDDAIFAAVDNAPERSPDAAPILTAHEAEESGLFSPFVKGYAASTMLPPSAIAYSHGMLDHAHSSSSSCEETLADDFRDISLTAAAAPVRAVHPERPDRLRAAGDIPCDA
jgi:hypothetical protein